MKAMREDIKAVEKIRKATNQLAKLNLSESLGPLTGKAKRRTGFPDTALFYLPNRSLCVPVRASVSTRMSFSIRYTSNQSL